MFFSGKYLFLFWRMDVTRSFVSLCFFLFFSLTSFSQPVKKYIIYFGQRASATERATCDDLKSDIEKVTNATVRIEEEPQTISGNEYHILIGSPATSNLIDAFAKKGIIQISATNPGPRGGIMKMVNDNGHQLLVLAGSDVEGVQNTVYDFSKNELGIDPLSYWTGSIPKKKPGFDPYAVKEKTIKPPTVPIICYFENDVDELANMKKPYLEYDMDTWHGMVNSLRRMHYNAIQLFDMLGRAEFFTREPYKILRPNYNTNLSLVDSLIDYAHLKGMKIQIDLSPGYEMRSLTDSEALCWTKYKQKWIDTWVYYLTKTPLGKADIFSLRPRNQVWDREYVSSCGENKTEVFNEVFAAFDSVLNIYKPKAPRLCICYGDGMEMFNEGFNPPKDFVVVWSDDGYCDFATLPKTTKGYNFGTYMHVGFWKNHTVHDPYPEKIDSVMTYMLQHYNATSYIDVNGQTFRPFLINLEAFAQWAYDPYHFNGKAFLDNWCRYYFNAAVVPYAIASMQSLHQAQFGRNGYVQNLAEIKQLLAFLSQGKNRKIETASEDHSLDSALAQRSFFVNEALQQASSGLSKTKDETGFYYDYIYLPALMYHQLLEFENTLFDAAHYKLDYRGKENRKEDIDKMKQLMTVATTQLKDIYKTCMEGDKNKKWATWYDPAKRRPNNGFPTLDMIDSINKNLNGLGN
jgi:hypothetical protein